MVPIEIKWNWELIIILVYTRLLTTLAGGLWTSLIEYTIHPHYTSLIKSNSRCILEVASDSGRSFDVILWRIPQYVAIQLCRDQERLQGHHGLQGSKRPERCKLTFVQLGSDFSDLYFIVSSERPKTLASTTKSMQRA